MDSGFFPPLWTELCVPTLQFICWSPNSQYLRIWVYLEMGVLKEVIKVKWSHMSGL